jgi:hypothetical protein
MIESKPKLLDLFCGAGASIEQLEEQQTAIAAIVNLFN